MKTYKKYLVTEAMSPQKIEKTLQKIKKEKDDQDKKDFMADLIASLHSLRKDSEKTVGKMNVKQRKAFRDSFEKIIDAVDTLGGGKGDTDKIMGLYQKWINITNGIINKRI